MHGDLFSDHLDFLERRVNADEFGDAVAFQIAAAHAWRGEIDAAFTWLDHAYAARDPGLGESVSYPWLWALHGDPRWHALMRKMGFR